MDWNVVATARDPHFPACVGMLRKFGTVEKTHFYNVVVMQVGDARGFLDELGDWFSSHSKEEELLSRASPCTELFNFQSPEEFEEKARAAASTFVPMLRDRRFHVRMHRRGFKECMRSVDEERFLDGHLLEELQKSGTAGSITFDDPDAIVVVETVDNRAGLAVWSRNDLERYSMLRLD
jgi:tRNA(Ser,Leu) C12 N-acetylase TAN1